MKALQVTPKSTSCHSSLISSAPSAVRSPQRQADSRKRKAARTQLAAERAAHVIKADGFLRLPEVLAIIPVSASTWWAGIRSGRFPAGIRVSARCTVWKSEQIRETVARLGKGVR